MIHYKPDTTTPVVLPNILSMHESMLRSNTNTINDCLKKGIEAFLGRKINVNDYDKFTLVYTAGEGMSFCVTYCGIKIGEVKTVIEFPYENDSFLDNKITITCTSKWIQA